MLDFERLIRSAVSSTDVTDLNGDYRGRGSRQQFGLSQHTHARGVRTKRVRVLR